MRVVVCVRQGLNGELGPFDAAAYECALRIPGAEVTLLSMGAEKTAELLTSLTRRGATRAILLCDEAFAGADTLATAYALSRAIRRIEPALVICGRQTLIGDTAQTGPMLAELLSYSLLTNVMELQVTEQGLQAKTRSAELQNASYPALITVERCFDLRFPRLGSKQTPTERWTAADIGADAARCGLQGSPTRVLETFENRSGKRKCRFIEPSQLEWAIREGLEKSRNVLSVSHPQEGELLSRVLAVGEAVRPYAEPIAHELLQIEPAVDAVIRAIGQQDPAAVLFAGDAASKQLAATVAARLSLGLCADCTKLEAKDDEMLMYRPALSGSLIAKIKSLTRPALATVRTEANDTADIILAAGYGVKDHMEPVQALAARLGASFAASRKLVDGGYAKYEAQVGLTGKTVAPPIYIAVGISGAVHHIAGMERSGTVIAVNPDKEAPIFAYADFGIVSRAEDLL